MRDDQIVQARQELEDVRFSNSSMLDRNGDLKGEIEALQKHIDVLQLQNQDLNTELERFVQTDEQIRSTLNRRDRVQDLRGKVDRELTKSYHDLERASPRRFK